ncbi:MAG: hypothetical protein DRR11_15920 [Gammaproteobacteria bacterium]|nr:MAG: hypothetical protein DRR11_15920 [Gammaproteobacteria bacterium]RLA33492.1 MAG: hypothetical protein DRR15_10315 [Gammaproteobacteria bacterium]
MKQTHTILALFVAVLALPMAAVGQPATTGTTANDETIDNIVVVGQKSLAELRREVVKAEEGFYSVFNKLNDQKDYDVRCFYESPTGSHLKNHVCRARFVTKAYSQHASRSGNKITRVANQDGNPAFIEKTAKYEQKMQTLIAANPELLAALVEYDSARTRFMVKREGSANN